MKRQLHMLIRQEHKAGSLIERQPPARGSILRRFYFQNQQLSQLLQPLKSSRTHTKPTARLSYSQMFNKQT